MLRDMYAWFIQTIEFEFTYCTHYICAMLGRTSMCCVCLVQVACLPINWGQVQVETATCVLSAVFIACACGIALMLLEPSNS